MAYITTQDTLESYFEINSGNTDSDEKANFPTLYDYALYLCGGDFTAFDDYNALANAMENDRQLKGIPIC